jgi:membrane protease YdiL (CAAX protease family)
VVRTIENQGYRPYYYQPYRPTVDPAAAERKNLFRLGFGLLIYLLATYALQIAAVVVCSRLFPTVYYDNDYFAVWVSLASYIVGMPIFFGIVGSMPKARPERKKMGAGNWIGFLAVAFALMYAGSFIASILMTVLETLRGQEITNAIAEQINNSTPLTNVLLAVVMAPIAEELIFRKWIIDRLLPYSEWLAVATSALLFGLIHGNFYQFFYAVLMGILFGVVYVKTGKILHTIIMHAIINFSAGCIPAFLNSVLPDKADVILENFNPWVTVSGLYSIAQFTLIVCGMIFLVRFLKHGKLETTGEKGLSLRTQIKGAWLNWGTLLMVGFCLIHFCFSLFI